MTFPVSTVQCWLQQLALPLCAPRWALHTLQVQFPARLFLPVPALPQPRAHLQSFPRTSLCSTMGATNKVHGHIILNDI